MRKPFKLRSHGSSFKDMGTPILNKKSIWNSSKGKSIAPKQRTEEVKNKYKPKKGSAAEVIVNEIVELGKPW